MVTIHFKKIPGNSKIYLSLSRQCGHCEPIPGRSRQTVDGWQRRMTSLMQSWQSLSFSGDTGCRHSTAYNVTNAP